MNIKRIVSLIVAVLMVLTVMSACGSDKKTESAVSEGTVSSDSTASSDNKDPASETEITDDDGPVNIADYTIVHPKFSTSYITKKEADKLIAAVKDKYNVELKYVDDSTAAVGKEIVLGLTNREGSRMLDNNDEYSIRVDGKKIFVEGGTDRSIAMALTELTALVKDGTELNNGFSKTGNYNENVKGYDAYYYKYVFGDDFDGTALDTDKWSFKDMSASDIKQEMNENTYFVGDGKISMFSTPILDSKTEVKYRTPRFLSTRGKMEFLYGCVEINAMIPFYKGNSSAFWFCSSTSTPLGYTCEIDMVELLGRENNVVSNLHCWGTMHTAFDGVIKRDDRSHTFESTPEVLRTEYHTYFMDWTPEYIDFGVDAEVYYHADITDAGRKQFKDPSLDLDAFRLPVFFIISEFLYTPGRNLGYGLKGDEGDFFYLMNVDHIDLYQMESQSQLIYF